MYVRYLTDELTDQEYQKALPTIFGELPVENLEGSEEFTQQNQNKKILNIESLPGQYDNVVDSVQQCLMLQT